MTYHRKLIETQVLQIESGHMGFPKSYLQQDTLPGRQIE